MLTTELLVDYGFEKVTSTPLQKWSFENIVLYVEKNIDRINFRVYDINDPSRDLCIKTEADFHQILKTVDEGGSISDYASEFNNHNEDMILPGKFLEFRRFRMN